MPSCDLLVTSFLAAGGLFANRLGALVPAMGGVKTAAWLRTTGAQPTDLSTLSTESPRGRLDGLFLYPPDTQAPAANSTRLSTGFLSFLKDIDGWFIHFLHRDYKVNNKLKE